MRLVLAMVNNQNLKVPAQWSLLRKYLFIYCSLMTFPISKESSRWTAWSVKKTLSRYIQSDESISIHWPCIQLKSSPSQFFFAHWTMNLSCHPSCNRTLYLNLIKITLLQKTQCTPYIWSCSFSLYLTRLRFQKSIIKSASASLRVDDDEEESCPVEKWRRRDLRHRNSSWPGRKSM